MARQTVIAFFSDRKNAEAAVLALKRSALATDDDLAISPAAAACHADDSLAHARQLSDKIEAMLTGSPDRHVYNAGVRRGFVVIAVRLVDRDVGRVISVLEQFGALDLDAGDPSLAVETWSAAGTGRQSSAGEPTRQAEIDRAAACVLAAASAADAYRPCAGEVRASSASATHDQDATPDLSHGAAPMSGHDPLISCGPARGGIASEGGAFDRFSTAPHGKGLEVVDRHGQHVGLIEAVEGTMMRVRPRNPASDGVLRLIPTAWIHLIDDRVTLKLTLPAVESRARLA